jgi:hypothetical protein
MALEGASTLVGTRLADSTFEHIMHSTNHGVKRMNEWVILRGIWKEMEEQKRTINKQMNLDGKVAVLTVPKGFTCEGALEAIARHIICDDQVYKSQ